LAQPVQAPGADRAGLPAVGAVEGEGVVDAVQQADVGRDGPTGGEAHVDCAHRRAADRLGERLAHRVVDMEVWVVPALEGVGDLVRARSAVASRNVSSGPSPRGRSAARRCQVARRR
jgi:hypothetical protein